MDVLLANPRGFCAGVERAIEIVAKTGVCHPEAPARKLNAAPLLNTSTRLKNPVSCRRSPGANASSTQSLVTRSAAMIAAATANQGSTFFSCTCRGYACGRGSPGPNRLLMQRLHSPGCSAFVPTSLR